MDVDISFLVQEARSIADVLATHKVFAVVEADATQMARAEIGARIAQEKERFVKAVVRHATDPKALQQHTLQYPQTGTWIRFNTATNSSGKAFLLFVDAVPAFSITPDVTTDPKINYLALANDIHFVREGNAGQSETYTLGDDLETATR